MREGKGRDEKYKGNISCLGGKEGKRIEMRVLPQNFFNFGGIDILIKIIHLISSNPSPLNSFPSIWLSLPSKSLLSYFVNQIRILHSF